MCQSEVCPRIGGVLADVLVILATHPGCRSPASQPWPQLKRGNTLRVEDIGSTSWKPLYAPARPGMRVMMMMMMMFITRPVHKVTERPVRQSEFVWAHVRAWRWSGHVSRPAVGLDQYVRDQLTSPLPLGKFRKNSVSAVRITLHVKNSLLRRCRSSCRCTVTAVP